MLTSTPWVRQTFDLPSGLSSVVVEQFGDWLYLFGSSTTAVQAYLSRWSDGGATLGPTWQPWTVAGGGFISGTGMFKLPTGLYGGQNQRRSWRVSAPGQDQAQLVGQSLSPVAIGFSTVTRGGVPIQPAFSSLTGVHNLFLSILGFETGDPRVIIQPESKDVLLDQLAPTSTTGRQIIIVDDLLVGVGGVSAGGLLPLTEIRATHVTDCGQISGNWKTIGTLPSVFEAQGLNRQRLARWRDWLLMVGGSVVAASTSSSTAGVWAAKISSAGDGSVGPWVQLADLPVTVRNCGLQVIGDYLHVLGGISDGVTSAGPYLSSIYTTRLQELQD